MNDIPLTVGKLIEESGRTPSPRIAEFTSLASSAQRLRLAADETDTSRITRSTALWTLMLIDTGIRQALRASKGNVDELGSFIGLDGLSPRPEGEEPAHDEFASALRAHLTSRSGPRSTVDLVDIAIAIMRSVRATAFGQLPRLLMGLGVSEQLALDNLNLLVSETGRREIPLSRSMRVVADGFSSAEPSASHIVVVIAGRHPEYAAGRLGAMERMSSTRRHRPWSDWYELVADLFDADVVATTRHLVLDTRLFLLGLCLADPEILAAFQREGAWTALITEIDEAVAPSGSPLWPVLNGVRFAHGYHNDGTAGADQLDVQGYVNAVCEVITDPHVKPPLSIGLFGKWGTGKSFFMEKMRERIDGRVPSDDDGFTITQIRFNAWHYADTSLWASLAIEIFERLADPEPVDLRERERWHRSHGDKNRAEREALLSELETYRDAKSTLDAERIQLEHERGQLVTKRSRAEEKRREEIEKVPLTEVAKELAKNTEIQGKLKDISKELGFEPAIDELTGLGKDLRTTAGYLPAVWRGVRHKSWFGTLAAAFAVLAVLTIALAGRGGVEWLYSLGGTVASIVGFTQLIRPAAQRVNTALGHVQDAIRITNETRESLRSKRSREERVLDLKLADAEHAIAETTQAITALDEKIATTRAAAEALSVGRKLYEFLNDRASGYQKHQGVVGTLHRDFRFLDALLRSQSRSRDAGVKPVSRVVLYIDDLDRCPPAKVLEVLEAVHLLLALELFVVVVGVDPRWLSSSLWHQYRDLAAGGDPRADAYLRGMPVEYLEKIFQIPFTLPEMEPAAYARLIGSVADLPLPPVPADPRDTIDAGRPVVTTREERTPARARLDVEPGSAAAAVPGERLGLTEPEVEFAQQLGALVTSPRAAKRLMNTYRLIRATRHVGSRSRFLGGDGRPGEFQAVLTLLAAVAGHPGLADRLLVALQDADGDSWAGFLAQVAPGTNETEPGELPHDFAEWARLHRGLEASRRPDMLDDLGTYRRWGR
ncbi:P-loop NTPase fold protein [Amycolatopsis solani]|uniref:P-loop NTPase fold protein n=1 Tax=Amycolatopsis solani TaxID=3028615 RepID=UPI00296F13BD|nr:P-loop NTPase fold protein [Amycolatopsis sp. MEP2-6]